MKKSLLLLATGIFCLTCVFGQDDSHENRELGNFLSSKAGATIHSCSGTDSTEWIVSNILDDTKGGKGTWRVKTLNTKTKEPKFPQWFVIELPREETISSMLFTTDFLTGKYACAKNITIEFSVTSPTSGYERVAFETIPHNKPAFYVSLPTSNVRWVRVTARNNWGNPYFLEMGRVYGYNDVAMDNYAYVLSSKGKLDLQNIFFEKGNSIIMRESLPVIEMIAKVMKDNPTWKINIEGHTDGDGDSHYNLTLSKRRAEAVLDALVISGIHRERLSAIGKGDKEKRIEVEESEADKAKNRRVVISLERSDDGD